jgi:hypothetical protein
MDYFERLKRRRRAQETTDESADPNATRDTRNATPDAGADA